MIDTRHRLSSEDLGRFQEMLDGLTANVPVLATDTLRFSFAVAETSLGPIDIFKFQALGSKSWGYQIGQHLFQRETDVVKARIACPDTGYKYEFPFRESIILSGVQAVFSLEEILNALSKGRITAGIRFQVEDSPPAR